MLTSACEMTYIMSGGALINSTHSFRWSEVHKFCELYHKLKYNTSKMFCVKITVPAKFELYITSIDVKYM